MKKIICSAFAIVLLSLPGLGDKRYENHLYKKLDVGCEMIERLNVQEEKENYNILDDNLIYESEDLKENSLDNIENLELDDILDDINNDLIENETLDNSSLLEDNEDFLEDVNEDLIECYYSYEDQAISKSFYYIPEIPLSEDLQRFTYEMCEDFDIDYSLVLAIMYHESKFDPYAVSYYSNGTCDVGIMQINSCNLKQLEEQFGITDLQNPYENIKAGVSIISGHVKNFGENDGLMAYNMGIGGYQSAISSGIYSTSYSREILQKKMEYEELVCF